MMKGAFAWYDLAVPDLPAAEAFYTQVMGWTAKPMVMAGMSFTMFQAGDVPVAAVRALGDLPAGAARGWRGFLGVDDVTAIVEQAVAAGAVLRHGPVGPPERQFAVLDDPQGARFAVTTREAGADGAVTSFAPGHVGWRELVSEDPEASLAFYAGLFGWAKGEGMSMGPMGTYQLFTLGGELMGAVMPLVPDSTPGWGFYFNVEAIDAALERVTGAGGQVLHEPMAVPGDMWVAPCRDHQNEAFSLVAPRR